MVGCERAAPGSRSAVYPQCNTSETPNFHCSPGRNEAGSGAPGLVLRPMKARSGAVGALRADVVPAVHLAAGGGGVAGVGRARRGAAAVDVAVAGDRGERA